MTRIVVVVAAALILAQWGAQQHAYSHDGEATANQHFHAKGCPQCPSFAPVLTAAGSSALFAAIDWAPIRLDESSLPVAPHEVRIALAFRSRAPPSS